MSSLHSENCIFCKIIQGEIPCAKVYEDDNVLAFLDLGQVTKGHTLVIPKVHQENVFELTPEVAGSLFQVVPKIASAIKDAYQPLGLNTLNNNGEIAGQSVFHFHMHLIPRYGKEDSVHVVWRTHENDYTSNDLQAIAKQIGEKIL